MAFVKKYKDFVKSNENTGYVGLQPMDPQMSTDPFDRNTALKTQRIRTLLQISYSLVGLRDGIDDLNADLVIKQVTIVKMFENSLGLLDIYIKFDIDDQEFMGIFQNWGGVSAPVFKSPSFEEVYYSASSKIKLIGMLKIIMNDYFKPEYGNWINQVGIYLRDEWGVILFVKPGSRLKVDEVITEDDHPKISLYYKDVLYHIQNIDYYWFKWNCSLEPKMKVSNI